LRRLTELRSKEGVTELDIKEFEKVELLMRSVNEVKNHAEGLKSVRNDPMRYSRVKSKVKKCLKI
jgi:hypothetical protein